MKRFVVLVVGSVLMFSTACGAGSKTTTDDATPAESHHGEPTSGPETSAEDVLPNDGTRQVGDITKCLVSGDVFRIADTHPKVEYEGGTYYFCCKGCVRDFNADPQKFLTQADGDAAPAESTDEQPDDSPASM